MGTSTKGKTHLSHSQISEFLQCPRRYHLHHRLGLEAAFQPAGLLFGSAVHEAIALYNQMRLEGREATLDALHEAFRSRWCTERLPVRLKSGRSEKALLASARKLLEAYLASRVPSGQVLAVEEPFHVRLVPELPEFWGAIDLVEQTAEGSLVLTDYKTASSRTEPEADQLVLYREALGVLGYPGASNARARYVMLIKAKEPAIEVIEPELGTEHSERLVSLYRAVWADIERGCSFPRRGWQCQDCQWQAHCDQA